MVRVGAGTGSDWIRSGLQPTEVLRDTFVKIPYKQKQNIGRSVDQGIGGVPAAICGAALRHQLHELFGAAKPL